MNSMSRLHASNSWKDLEKLGKDENLSTIEKLFHEEPTRAKRIALELNGLYLDCSRNQIDKKTQSLLLNLCDQAHVSDQINAMFMGKKINISEYRAVLHTALRSSDKSDPNGPLDEIRKSVHTNLEQMQRLTDTFRSGKLFGATGEQIDTVINIGIGGSDLGPKLVYNALKTNEDPRILFVSNIDDADLNSKLQTSDAARTLFIVASKTFTTAETITNANTAIAWLCKRLNVNDHSAIKHHFVATTANPNAAKAFGIQPNNIFKFWDWVGGRYSLWSAVGLPIALGLGFHEFKALLKGAEKMDLHFKSAPNHENLPIMLALTGVWHINFREYPAQAILPYTERLSLFPEYLQQLEMESNGKMTDKSEKSVPHHTAPIIWGSRGTNFQHSFAQHLLQSPTITPCDFIGVIKNRKNDNTRKSLLANCLAQIEALAFGNRNQKSLQGEKKASRIIEGNRPSNVILLDELSASSMGSLLALYEHKVFVQGLIWNINSFDQWGVELGKSLAKVIERQLGDEDIENESITSNANLLEKIKMSQ
ncbi:MAG: glucose-6-phosphate isomerase [Burkholderiales bacterium]|nr:glucose-6-phosphate isomerase [Burkholderiales bacterium]OUT79334.1 MAG: glucose-6-phosphate isomerase [Betaproteobacteria bacterium TMED22]